MLSVAMGEEVPPEYGPMIAAELGLGPPPPAPEAVPEGFRAIIIGAGVSGLATSIKLAEAGIPHIVLERNSTVGGTWLENHYPGAGVDTPSALYSFSFAPRDWTMYFALRDELHAYLEQLADEFGVRERIRFDTEVHGGDVRRGRAGVGPHDHAGRDAAGQRRHHRRGRVQQAQVARARPRARSTDPWCTPRAGRRICRWPASGSA